LHLGQVEEKQKQTRRGISVGAKSVGCIRHSLLVLLLLWLSLYNELLTDFCAHCFRIPADFNEGLRLEIFIF